ncbi:MAG: cysteine desulfurase NifS [Acidobacteriia bacterium]|nr:cysteine desulfurase NifS [Terriglobia bacterium]
MMRVYFDHNATTPVAPEVLAAMLPYFSEEYGNASSIHTFGQRGRGAVEQARESVAALLGARPAEIMFSSGGTESNNHAIFGVVGAASGERKHVITSAIEHSAVLDPCEALQRRGVAVTVLPVDREGLVNPEDVRRAIRPETVLITIMLANNELGTLEPIEEIGKIAAETGVTVHTDAVQAAGKVPIDVTRLGVHLLSISAHKLYGPKGVGALYVRKGTRLEPLMYGGHSERDRRPGTEDVPGIAGLGKAAELAMMRMKEERQRIAALRDRLEKGLLERVPYARVNGSRAHRMPNTTNLTFPFVEGEAMVIALDLQGIACSTGAACSSGAVKPSHVLTAIGLAPEDARATLRLSLGHQTTNEEIDYALDTIPPVIERLRQLSPTYKKPVTAPAR